MTTPSHDPDPYAAHVLSGESGAVRKLRLQIARIAPHFRVAMVTGEPGAGHQTVARHLHLSGPMASRSFVAIPSVDLPHRPPQSLPDGTIYLQDIETMLPAAQGKLLRALKSLDRETRVVVPTRTNLKGMVSTGRLRNDLYEAVAVLEIHVAPLRDRRDDVETLTNAMLREHRANPTLRPDAIRHLKNHTWPGNLQELWQLCSRLAPLTRAIQPDDLFSSESDSSPAVEAVRLEEVMHRHVMDVLEGCAGNKLRAAELLGISRSTLYRMLESAAPTVLVR